MKKISTFLLIIFFTLFSFSQTKTEIHGKVLSQEIAIQNADVVNFTTKKNTTTNENGEFYIEAKVNDQLIIISKNYFDKKIVISQLDFTKSVLIIQLEAKPIELDEVKIRAKESVKNLVTYDDLAQIRIAKENSPLRNAAVFDGKIINGMDFVQIGKMIGKLFKSNKKQNKKVQNNIDFKEYAKSNFSEEFYTKTLELQQEEIALFLDLCESDSKSKQILETEDEFALMDFLISKKQEFVKMMLESKK